MTTLLPLPFSYQSLRANDHNGFLLDGDVPGLLSPQIVEFAGKDDVHKRLAVAKATQKIFASWRRGKQRSGGRG